MRNKVVVAGSTVSASQLKDFFRQIEDGSIDHDILQGWLDRRMPILNPPPGGRIYILRVPVRLDRPWVEAVNVAGPDTSENNYSIWNDGYLYWPHTGIGTVEKEMILLNLHPGSWHIARKWGQQNGLKRTAPRDVFAIAENVPDLNHHLADSSMCVTATQECVLGGYGRACCVLWSDRRRTVDLALVSLFGDNHVWFAFFRE